ncbi:MAG: SMI1/KNR4 family protein [Sedimentitalea sp.]
MKKVKGLTMKSFWGIAALRITFAIALLWVCAWFGFAFRSPWVIPFLGLAFSVLYVCGKWYVWRNLWAQGGYWAWAKALPLTVVTQFALAGLIYSLGLGIGRLFANQPLAQSVSSSDLLRIAVLTAVGIAVSMIIDRLEGGRGPLEQYSDALQNQVQEAAKNPKPDKREKGADFVVLEESITPQTLLSSYRGSQDYSNTALTRITAHSGRKPDRVPFAANDLAISETEMRTGFKLPNTLKQIYKLKDGGSTHNIRIAKVSNPSATYDDWESAFGGYDDLHSLKSLRTVHESILDFASEDETDAFPEGAKRMLILAQYYQQTTFLDYRNSGEPRVGIADFDQDNWEEKGLWFDGFDAFFAKLARVESDWERPQAVQKLSSKGPSPAHADGFWRFGGAADHGVDDIIWSEAEQRLGLPLPVILRPFLSAANGGTPHFNLLPELSTEMEQDDRFELFPGGGLLGVHLWVPLKTLSDRLTFTFAHTPWADLWRDSEKLIVLSARFDTALMLDYRFGDTPKVLFVKSLDDVKSAIDLGRVDEFCTRLRAPRDPSPYEQPIGDIRLSARSINSESFWLSGGKAGVSEADLKAHQARLDHDFPDALKNWMQIQNGGQVRFRFLPPLKANPHGYLNPQISAGQWVDVFPDGILQMEKWQTLTTWLSSNSADFGEALRQRGASQYVQDDYGDPGNIIVLAEGNNRLTLLDKSRERSQNNATLVQLVKETSGWLETHRSPVIRATSLSARKDELSQ